MTIKTTIQFVGILVTVAGILASTNKSVYAQQPSPIIEATLTSLDSSINRGAFGEAQRLQAQLVNLVFAEIKAHPPMTFEQSRGVFSSATNVAELLYQTDAIRQAVRKPDFILARDLAMHLSVQKLGNGSAMQSKTTLATLEDESLTKPKFPRFLSLPKLARAAFDSGDLKKANSYCSEALATSTMYNKNLTGEVIHDCNIIQGRILLLSNDIAGASAYLVMAGQTSGSPALATFGPNMSLAHELLIRGERSSVLKYLSECSQFWKSDNGKLSSWTASINQGKVPDFGPNLSY